MDRDVSASRTRTGAMSQRPPANSAVRSPRESASESERANHTGSQPVGYFANTNVAGVGVDTNSADVKPASESQKRYSDCR